MPGADATASAADALPAGGGRQRRYVWDGATRLFHWLVVGLIAFSWWSAKNYHMDWHYKSGLTVLGLLIFRLLWGVVGTSTARFRQFVKGPQGVWAYARGRSPASVGHNPLGGWSVVALLLSMTVQVTSGLFTVDTDGIESGPLSYLVSFDQGRAAAGIHEWSFDALLALVSLHVLAIVFYLVVKRRNLVGAMVTGYERTDEPMAISRVGWIRLAGAVAVAAVATWYIAGGLKF